MGLVLTILLSLFMVFGAFLAASAKHTHRVEILSISVALGAMIALLFLDLIPEALEAMEERSIIWIPVCALIGIGILKILDHFVPEHDHHHGFDHHCTEENLIHIGVVSAVAVILHNVIEGMAVYSVYTESSRMGYLMSLGIGLHNIPMGMVIYTTLAGETKTMKILLMAGASLSTFLGGIIMALFVDLISEFAIGIMISLTMGMLIYIVLFELIPHLMHAKEKKLALAGVAVGLTITFVSTLLG